MPESVAAPGQVSAKRLIVSPDQVLRAMEAKLQPAADKAVAAAISAGVIQLNTCVNHAVTAIEEFQKASARQFEEHCMRYRDKLVASATDEVLARLQADFALAEKRTQEQLASLAQAREKAQEKAHEVETGARIRVAEAVDTLQSLACDLQDGFSKQLREAVDRTVDDNLQGFETSLTSLAAQTLANCRAHQETIVDDLARSAQQQVDQIRRHLEAVDRTAAENLQGLETSLTSLAAQTLANCRAHQETIVDELARSAQQQVDQIRRHLEAMVNAVVMAMSVANEQSTTLLDSLAKDASKRLEEAVCGPQHRAETSNNMSNGSARPT